MTMPSAHHAKQRPLYPHESTARLARPPSPMLHGRIEEKQRMLSAKSHRVEEKVRFDYYLKHTAFVLMWFFQFVLFRLFIRRARKKYRAIALHLLVRMLWMNRHITIHPRVSIHCRVCLRVVVRRQTNIYE